MSKKAQPPRRKTRIQLLEEWCAQHDQTPEEWTMFAHSIEGGQGREYVRVPQISLPAVLWKRIKTMIADPRCGFASDSQVVATALADLVVRYEYMAWPDSDEAMAFKRLMKLRAEQTKHQMEQDEVRNSQIHCQALHDSGHYDTLRSYCIRMRDLTRVRKVSVDVRMNELAISWLARLAEIKVLEQLRQVPQMPQLNESGEGGEGVHQPQQAAQTHQTHQTHQTQIVYDTDVVYTHPLDEGYVPVGEATASKRDIGCYEQVWFHPDNDLKVKVAVNAAGEVVKRVRVGDV